MAQNYGNISIIIIKPQEKSLFVAFIVFFRPIVLKMVINSARWIAHIWQAKRKVMFLLL